MLSTWIQRIEQRPISFWAFLATFFAIGAIRFLLDAYSTGLQSTFSIENLPHGLLFFGSTFASFAVLLKLLTRKRVTVLLRVLLSGWLIIWIPPIVDLLWSRGQGGVILSYLFDAPANLPLRFLSFFGGSLTYEFTLGLRAEVAAAMLLLGIYVWYSTRSWWKTALGVLGAYVVLFVYAASPTLAAALSAWDWSLTREGVLDIVYRPRLFFAIDVIDPPRVAGMYLSTTFALLLSVQLSLLALFERRAHWRSFLKMVRPWRLAFQGAAIIAGLVLGTALTETPLSLGLAELLLLLVSASALFWTWVSTVAINDLSDRSIDAVVHTDRPLITGALSVHRLRHIAVLGSLLSVLAAYTLGFPFVTLIVTILACSWLYSMRPFRLRRFPVVATGLMALNVFFAILFFFLLFAPGQSYSAFPRPLIALIVAIFTIVFLVKDLRDHVGDAEHGVHTLSTILGPQRGALATALLASAALFFVPLFFSHTGLLLLALPCAIASFFLIKREPFDERPVFVVYAVFFALAALVLFF